MQKTPYLSSSILLSQIQSRLAKNSYLSESDAPSSADAQVFLAIQKIKKFPNRQSHPSLYHWFIIMKQFAKRTIQIWIKRGEESGFQDKLINQFIFQITFNPQSVSQQMTYNQQQNNRFLASIQLNQPNQAKPVNFCKKIQRRKTSISLASFNKNPCLTETQLEKTSYKRYGKNEGLTALSENQYIIQMDLLVENNSSLQQIKRKLAQQSLAIYAFNVKNERIIQVIAEAQALQYDKVINKLSKWPEIIKISFRKEKNKAQNKIRSQRYLASSLIRRLTSIEDDLV